ncbi:DUF2871 family protein [Terrilactibacillus sp. BCM23-1]|uniref:DUF2871 family protein n=1 Tax=Terrilactibacillus tamarindi TaxID=2599694 RepID=A0A6N8CNT7_9BACI|nr:DUF2871 domain-containing protein [Terrilactibacillus tamarindi]MTT31308.1 DUF2871 family protein [Terrilactibacillus tamarindi]
MKKLYFSALIYMILGLLAGIFYREITKAYNFTGQSMLSVLHTHLLALGMMMFLIFLVLEKLFTLSKSKLFLPFFWLYNIGLLWTIGFMVIHGTMTVLGKSVGPAISGMAGLGHILLTVALVLFFIILFERLKASKSI